MLEQVAGAWHSIEIHLLYASIVWLAAWLVTSIRGSATTKYWIWVATSLNFIVPVSTVLDLMRPARLFRVTPLNVIRIAGNAVSMNGRASAALLVVWLLGASMMLLRLFLRIRADRRVEASRQVPAVDGIFRPQITLPDGIDRLLTKDELNAVLIHELTHAKRRDNLIRLLHEVTLCALWFHPLVWMAGSRLALYRELSCDESVSRRGYADDLVSALAKVANPDEALLLQSTASSFIGERLTFLTAHPPQGLLRAVNALLAVIFAAVLLSSALGSVTLASEKSAGCVPAEISEIDLVEGAVGLSTR